MQKSSTSPEPGAQNLIAEHIFLPGCSALASCAVYPTNAKFLSPRGREDAGISPSTPDESAVYRRATNRQKKTLLERKLKLSISSGLNERQTAVLKVRNMYIFTTGLLYPRSILHKLILPGYLGHKGSDFLKVCTKTCDKADPLGGAITVSQKAN